MTSFSKYVTVTLMSLRCLFLSFFKIGLLAFGGGYAIVSLLHTEYVERKKCLTAAEFSDFYALSQTFPGVISVNFAAFIGHKIAGIRGTLTAVLGMICPAIIAILILASFIQQAESYPTLQHALSGVRIAVAAMILNLTTLQARNTIHSHIGIAIAVLTLALLKWGISPVIPLVLAGGFGVFYYYRTGRILK